MQLQNLNPPVKAICTTTDGARTNVPVYVVKTYKDGTEWYRKYSDGTIVQGGYITGLSTNTEKTFPFVTSFQNPDSVKMHVTNIFTGDYSTYRGGIAVTAVTSDTFTVWSDALTASTYNDTTAYWEARGV